MIKDKQIKETHIMATNNKIDYLSEAIKAYKEKGASFIIFNYTTTLKVNIA